MGIDNALDDSKTQTGTVNFSGITIFHPVETGEGENAERGALPGFTICKTNLKHLQIHTKNQQLIVACANVYDKPEIILKL